MSEGKVIEVKTVFDEDDANELLKGGWDLFSVTYRGTGAALGLTMVKRAEPTTAVRRATTAQPRATTGRTTPAAPRRTAGDQPRTAAQPRPTVPKPGPTRRPAPGPQGSEPADWAWTGRASQPNASRAWVLMDGGA